MPFKDNVGWQRNRAVKFLRSRCLMDLYAQKGATHILV